LIAEPTKETIGDPKHSTGLADIFPDHQDPLILVERRDKGIGNSSSKG
jgi:hypothetical protein